MGAHTPPQWTRIGTPFIHSSIHVHPSVPVPPTYKHPHRSQGMIVQVEAITTARVPLVKFKVGLQGLC